MGDPLQLGGNPLRRSLTHGSFAIWWPLNQNRFGVILQQFYRFFPWNRYQSFRIDYVLETEK